MIHLNTIRGLRFRYIAGLGAIALLVTTSFISMLQVVSQQRDNSRLVNLAGHQAGLSNRIAYFAGLMATTEDEEEFNIARGQVGRTINKMRSAHRALTMGDQENGIPYVTNENLEIIYNDPSFGLDLALTEFLERAGKVYEYKMEVLDIHSIDYLYITTYGPHVLEPMLDAAVDEYEKIGRAAIFRIERLEQIIWVVTLLTLLIELIFIFRPMERHVRKTIETLESSIDELTKTRKRLLAAQKLAKVGDWEWRRETGALTCSDQIYEICGTNPDKMSTDTDTALAFIHPDDKEKVRLKLNSLTEDKQTLEVVHRIVRSDGSARHVSQHIAASIGADQRVAILSGTIQDITERQKVKLDLERSKSLLETTLESTADGILVVDINGRWSGFNQKFVDIFHIPESIRCGGNGGVALDYIFNSLAQPDLFRDMVQNLQQDASAVTFDNIPLKDGRILESYTQPQRLGNNIIGRVWTFRDVSDRKKIELDLRESEELHKELFELSPVALYLQDFSAVAEYVDGLRQLDVGDLKTYLSSNKHELKHLVSLAKVKQANKAAVDLYKAESVETLLHGFSSMIDLDNAQHFIDQVAAFTDGKDSYEGEATNYDQAGKAINIILHKAVINRDVNGLSKILVSVVDITELRKALSENTELGNRLRQAQKMEAIGTLAGGIAHDFNNILGAILGYSELAKMNSTDNAKALHHLEQICIASERARDLVDQILAFSRQSKAEMLPVDIGIIIKEALKLLRATIPATIQIFQNVNTNLGSVKADQTQIHQVIINLCTNALHAMEAEGGRLEVELVPVTLSPEDAPSYPGLKPGRYLKLTVADTGQGIEPDKIDRIFDPYFTTKEVGEGTGLGLATVHGIVKSHGGDIKVYSEPSVGSAFKALFPVIPARGKQKTRSTNRIPAGSERILLVDDEKSLVDIGKELLEKVGYQVEALTDPIIALRVFRSRPDTYDLVITDMTMPVMTGAKLAAEIRKTHPGTPIILCTGFSNGLIHEHVKQMGIDRLLLKPLNLSKLAKTVRTVLDISKRAA